MAETNGSRVTVRELYNLILKQNEERYAMERRILERIDNLTSCVQPMETRLEIHGKEIERLRNKSDRWDAVNTVIALVGSAIAGWLGLRN